MCTSNTICLVYLKSFSSYVQWYTLELPWPKAYLVKIPTLSCLEKWYDLLLILTQRVHFREAYKFLHTFGIDITYPASKEPNQIRPRLLPSVCSGITPTPLPGYMTKPSPQYYLTLTSMET